MTTNPFFSSSYFATTKDQALLNDLNRESIQVQGIDVKYIRREFVNYDQLFGEDQSSRFDSAYTIEFYLKSFDSFGGDGTFLSKFGLEIRDEITFVVSQQRFTEEVLANEPDITRPMEGDLIWVQPEIDKRSRVFEITYVNEEEAFYQLGKLYTWEIKCKVFEFAGEEFETGDVNIDAIEDYGINKLLQMTAGGSGDFLIGEEVTITGTTSKGEVVNWDNVEEELLVTNIVGEFETGEVVGTTSGATWNIDVIEENNNSISSNSDNDFVDLEKTNIIDNSESNPFSE